MRKFSPYLLLCLATACGGGGDACSTPGELGRTDYSYVSGADCRFGCQMDPMLVGTLESVRVNPREAVEALSVVSTKPEVVRVRSTTTTFECHHGGGQTTFFNCAAPEDCKADCDARVGSFRAVVTFGVEAMGLGSSDLEVHDRFGRVFDRLEVDVKEAKKAKLNLTRVMGEEATTEVYEDGDVTTVREGDVIRVVARLENGGDRLQASMTRLTSSVPAVGALEVGEDDPRDAEQAGTNGAGFVPVSAGRTRLTVEGGGVSASIDVDVVGP